MYWNEHVTCIGDGEDLYEYGPTWQALLKGTGDSVWSPHGNNGFSGKNSITFSSDNQGNCEFCNDPKGWVDWWSEPCDFHISHTTNPTG